MQHPTGVLVDVVGIESSNRGRKCEEHDPCGVVVQKDTLLRFRAVQIDEDGMETTALAAYWVTDGVDRCRVGFLRRHLIPHKDQYDGKLGQVVEVFNNKSESPSDRAKHKRNMGCCRVAMVETIRRDDGDDTKPAAKKQKKT